MVTKIKISSDIHNMILVEKFFNDIFHKLKFSRKIYCKIYLAITEAVNNAIIHGNGKDLSKKVEVNFIENDDQYIFEVKDEGHGFNFADIDDPREYFNRRKESGRGIFIMKQYADKVIYNNNGTLVQLIFNK